MDQAPTMTMRRVYSATVASEAVGVSDRTLKTRAEEAARRDGRQRVWDRSSGHAMNTSLYDADWIIALAGVEGREEPGTPAAVVPVPLAAGDPTPVVQATESTTDVKPVDDQSALVARLTEAVEMERRAADTHNIERLQTIIAKNDETILFLQDELNSSARNNSQLAATVSALSRQLEAMATAMAPAGE